ncbi:ABC transporter ATP-binding protein [Sporosarcina sp. 179-K 3D1 HS]|uniref:ABC transporter ATP-binding protein n=1 Tax=Sporosarcina sp. 179-K 3D1 HS TaxID=3232169 RepID=UPI0039A0BB6D
MLKFDGVSYSYDGQTNILDRLSFQVYPEEFISIVGASGSGKSTLFRLATGLASPSAGRIVFNGKIDEPLLGNVGYMPQQDLLLPWRTIIENACLPLEVKGMKKRAARERVVPLLDQFGLGGTGEKYPAELSGGMKQRVAFLRAVLSGSPLLLLDEPFSALDAITRLSMQEWLLRQWDLQKSTILFITHDVEEALFLSDRIFVVQNSPVTSLEEMVVPLPRPRTRKDLHAPAILALKEQLLETLKSEVRI